MKEFGDTIRAVREARGREQKDVAAAIGRPPSWVSGFELGKKKNLPEPEELKALAVALGVSRLELLQGAGYLDSEEVDPVVVAQLGPFPAGDIRSEIVEQMKSPKIPEQMLLGMSQMLEGILHSEG